MPTLFTLFLKGNLLINNNHRENNYNSKSNENNNESLYFYCLCIHRRVAILDLPFKEIIDCEIFSPLCPYYQNLVLEANASGVTPEVIVNYFFQSTLFDYLKLFHRENLKFGLEALYLNLLFIYILENGICQYKPGGRATYKVRVLPNLGLEGYLLGIVHTWLLLSNI